MLNFERVRRISVNAHVKVTTSAAGQAILTESGAAVAGTAGEQAKQVT